MVHSVYRKNESEAAGASRAARSAGRAGGHPGCRNDGSYTFIWTLFSLMRAAGGLRHPPEFVIADRPNPLGGLAVEGAHPQYDLLCLSLRSCTGCASARPHCRRVGKACSLRCSPMAKNCSVVVVVHRLYAWLPCGTGRAPSYSMTPACRGSRRLPTCPPLTLLSRTPRPFCRGDDCKRRPRDHAALRNSGRAMAERIAISRSCGGRAHLHRRCGARHTSFRRSSSTTGLRAGRAQLEGRTPASARCAVVSRGHSPPLRDAPAGRRGQVQMGWELVWSAR